MAKVPGVQVAHAIITFECRNNRGDFGAFDEAVNRLRAQYDQLASLRGDEVDLHFHLILSLESERHRSKKD